MGGPEPAIAATRLAVRPYVTEPVTVACSGGADSVALAAAVAFEAPGSSLVTVDHGLQQGSAARAEAVVALGESLGLRSRVVTVEVGTAGGPEAAARAARYAALPGDRVLLAHTLDDQAETVLLGLGRGSGPRSIAGMAAVDGRWVRPFLGLRRVVTVAACAAQGLPVWEDPHNTDPRFQRARLRHEVLPLLEDVLQGGVAEALARTAALVRADADALDLWAATQSADPPAVINTRPDRPGAAGTGVDQLEVEALATLPRAVRTRVLRAWATAHGARPLTATHTASLDALVTDWHGQGAVPLPGGMSVQRVSGRLVACPNSTPTSSRS